MWISAKHTVAFLYIFYRLRHKLYIYLLILVFKGQGVWDYALIRRLKIFSVARATFAEKLPIKRQDKEAILDKCLFL